VKKKSVRQNQKKPQIGSLEMVRILNIGKKYFFFSKTPVRHFLKKTPNRFLGNGAKK
jgi:hypothetical protein